MAKLPEEIAESLGIETWFEANFESIDQYSMVIADADAYDFGDDRMSFSKIPDFFYSDEALVILIPYRMRFGVVINLDFAPVDETGRVIDGFRPPDCPEKLDLERFLQCRIEWENSHREHVVPAACAAILAERDFFLKLNDLVLELERVGKKWRNWAEMGELTVAYQAAVAAILKAKDVRGARYSSWTLSEALEIFNQTPIDLWPGVYGDYPKLAGLHLAQRKQYYLTGALSNAKVDPWRKTPPEQYFWESKFSRRQVIRVADSLQVIDVVA